MLLPKQGGLPDVSCLSTSDSGLTLAVGSYTENRNLIQGSSQSAGGADSDDEPNKKYWFLNIKRYRRFFNVDTEVNLLHRMNVACELPLNHTEPDFTVLQQTCTAQGSETGVICCRTFSLESETL